MSRSLSLPSSVSGSLASPYLILCSVVAVLICNAQPSLTTRFASFHQITQSSKRKGLPKWKKQVSNTWYSGNRRSNALAAPSPVRSHASHTIFLFSDQTCSARSNPQNTRLFMGQKHTSVPFLPCKPSPIQSAHKALCSKEQKYTSHTWCSVTVAFGSGCSCSCQPSSTTYLRNTSRRTRDPASLSRTRGLKTRPFAQARTGSIAPGCSRPGSGVGYLRSSPKAPSRRRSQLQLKRPKVEHFGFQQRCDVNLKWHKRKLDEIMKQGCLGALIGSAEQTSESVCKRSAPLAIDKSFRTSCQF
jgi:hypothetical protein